MVVLFGVAGLEQSLILLAELRRAVPSLVALDFFDAAALESVRRYRGLAEPFTKRHDVYLLAECRSDTDPTPELAAAVEATGLDPDVAVADDSLGREALWAYRELQNESIAAAGIPHKLDISIAIGALPKFVAEVRRLVAAVAVGAVTILYGHLGDGNVHVNVLGPAARDERVDIAVLELVASFGGSISAEHGVGIAKRDHLSLTRSDAEIRVMSRLKTALDPPQILNPGCVLPVAASTRA